MWSSDGESLFLNQNLRMILSLNTEDVLSVILTIERENPMKPHFNLFKKPFSCELEYGKHVIPFRR